MSAAVQKLHVPVHVTLHGLASSERLRDGIRGDFDRLKDEHPALHDCRVAVEMVNSSGLPCFCAHVELRLAQRQIIASGVSETVPSALRRALDAARGQLAMPPY